MYLRRHRAAKVWLFLAVMAHAFVLSALIFTSSSGFHFYYLLLPSCLFLLFDEDEKYIKPILMMIGLALFFLCDNYHYTEPLIVLSSTAEKIIFSSTILAVMLEIYLIAWVFSKAIAKNEMLLNELATKDPLTGLNNRRIFIEIAQELLVYAQRNNKPMSLVILDIDYFKSINDTHGHTAGDYVLKQVAAILEKRTRASDLLARYGGEEFVIALPDSNAADALSLMEQLRMAIESKVIETTTGNTVTCTASFGIAESTDNLNSLESLTHNADIALYQAKVSGRNKVVVYQPSLEN